MKKFAIAYDKSITEDIFKALCRTLKDMGYTPRIHCDFEHTYENFCEKGYIRSNCSGDLKKKASYCIDNNAQNLPIITIADFKLDIEITSYSIY